MVKRSFIVIGLISSILIGGGCGFLFSFLYIESKTPPEYSPDPMGRIIQTQFKTIDEFAEILNTTTIEQPMPKTNLTIDKVEGTYLLIRFTGTFLHLLSNGFRGESNFIINLKLDGEIIGNTAIIYNKDNSDPLIGPIWFSENICLEYVTDILPPGVYDVEITWYSSSNCYAPFTAESSYLQGWTMSFPYNRTLLVQEIVS